MGGVILSTVVAGEEVAASRSDMLSRELELDNDGDVDDASFSLRKLAPSCSVMRLVREWERGGHVGGRNQM